MSIALKRNTTAIPNTRNYEGVAVPPRRIRAYPKRARLSVKQGIAYLMLFAIVSGVFTFVISLGGFVFIEQARQAAISAEKRAYLAETSAQELRREVEWFQSSAYIDEWAAIQGYVPSNQVKE